MQDYFRHLNRIEFVITNACTGRCKHCSAEAPSGCGGHVDGGRGAEIVRQLCASYRIESLMTFGGEPLLYPADVCQIHAAARDCGIPRREVITNGYFTKSESRIHGVAQMLADCGVNKVLLSADAFHQEVIPLPPVLTFAKAVRETGVALKVHPAWLVSREDDNPYNRRTQEILAIFEKLGIEVSNGNVIFPTGNALRYLGAYFDDFADYVNPYEEPPDDIATVCIDADGGVLGGNIYRQDMREILAHYKI